MKKNALSISIGQLTPEEYYKRMEEYNALAKPIINSYVNYMSLQTMRIRVLKNGGIQPVYDEKTMAFMEGILKTLEYLRDSCFENSHLQ